MSFQIIGSFDLIFHENDGGIEKTDTWYSISFFVCETLLINHWKYFSKCRPLSLLCIFKRQNVQRDHLDVPIFPSSKPSVELPRVSVKCFSKLERSSRLDVPLIGKLFPRIDVNHISKAWLTFSYTQIFTLCQLSDVILNGS